LLSVFSVVTVSTAQTVSQETKRSFVYEEFELIEGVEVSDIDFWQELISGSYSRRRVIQLKEGANKGVAEAAFFEPSAKYDITVFYVEGKQPDAKLRLLINDQLA